MYSNEKYCLYDVVLEALFFAAIVLPFIVS